MATEDKKTQTLQQQMNDITFKNSQANMIASMRNENARLKTMLGRKNAGRRVSAAAHISGLKTLGR